MRQVPAWGWSVASVATVLLSLLPGVAGPGGRTVSRALFLPAVSLLLATTLFSYMQQYIRPTKRLGIINVGAVVVFVYVTIPLWHFGVVLPVEPGGQPRVAWWVNVLVLAAGVGVYFLLDSVTRPLRPGPNAVEEKREHLTI